MSNGRRARRNDGYKTVADLKSGLYILSGKNAKRN